jgi:Aromatic-ring hydroxylase, C-terminal
MAPVWPKPQKQSGVPLDILDVADPTTRDLYGADLVLIRPDQHIAWRGAKSPGDASAILARVVGA